MTHIIQGIGSFCAREMADAELYRRWRADAEPMRLAGWRDPAQMSLAQVEARIERLTKEHGDDFVTFLICLLDVDPARRMVGSPAGIARTDAALPDPTRPSLSGQMPNGWALAPSPRVDSRHTPTDTAASHPH